MRNKYNKKANQDLFSGRQRLQAIQIDTTLIDIYIVCDQTHSELKELFESLRKIRKSPNEINKKRGH